MVAQGSASPCSPAALPSTSAVLAPRLPTSDWRNHARPVWSGCFRNRCVCRCTLIAQRNELLAPRMRSRLHSMASLTTCSYWTSLVAMTSTLLLPPLNTMSSENSVRLWSWITSHSWQMALPLLPISVGLLIVASRISRRSALNSTSQCWSSATYRDREALVLRTKKVVNRRSPNYEDLIP